MKKSGPEVFIGVLVAALSACMLFIFMITPGRPGRASAGNLSGTITDMTSIKSGEPAVVWVKNFYTQWLKANGAYKSGWQERYAAIKDKITAQLYEKIMGDGQADDAMADPFTGERAGISSFEVTDVSGTDGNMQATVKFAGLDHYVRLFLSGSGSVMQIANVEYRDAGGGSSFLLQQDPKE